jgi:hypothetical protein
MASWQFLWKAGSSYGKPAVFMASWKFLWKAGSSYDKLAVLMESWQFLCQAGSFYANLQFLWHAGSFSGKLDAPMESWQFLGKAGSFYGKLAVPMEDDRTPPPLLQATPLSRFSTVLAAAANGRPAPTAVNGIAIAALLVVAPNPRPPLISDHDCVKRTFHIFFYCKTIVVQQIS